jgi:hypothetical protein
MMNSLPYIVECGLLGEEVPSDTDMMPIIAANLITRSASAAVHADDDADCANLCEEGQWGQIGIRDSLPVAGWVLAVGSAPSLSQSGTALSSSDRLRSTANRAAAPRRCDA